MKFRNKVYPAFLFPFSIHKKILLNDKISYFYMYDILKQRKITKKKNKRKATKIIRVGKCVQSANAKRNIANIHYKISDRLELFLTKKQTKTSYVSSQLPLTYRKFTHTNFIIIAGPSKEGVQGVQTLFWKNYLWSAYRLMMLYISINFHEHILNGFQLI